MNKDCPDNTKIRNPLTNRCVYKHGKIGKKILGIQNIHASSSSQHKEKEKAKRVKDSSKDDKSKDRTHKRGKDQSKDDKSKDKSHKISKSGQKKVVPSFASLKATMAKEYDDLARQMNCSLAYQKLSLKYHPSIHDPDQKDMYQDLLNQMRLIMEKCVGEEDDVSLFKKGLDQNYKKYLDIETVPKEIKKLVAQEMKKPAKSRKSRIEILRIIEVKYLLRSMYAHFTEDEQPDEYNNAWMSLIPIDIETSHYLKSKTYITNEQFKIYNEILNAIKQKIQHIQQEAGEMKTEEDYRKYYLRHRREVIDMIESKIQLPQTMVTQLIEENEYQYMHFHDELVKEIALNMQEADT